MWNVYSLLFRSYCLDLYDIALWYKYTAACVNKFRSCYNKCLKLYSGYSLTRVLMETGVPSFDTVIHNCSFVLTDLGQTP